MKPRHIAVALLLAALLVAALGLALGYAHIGAAP